MMAAAQMNVLLHPAAEDVAETHGIANRLSGLEGLKIGLIDNRKKNSDVFLEELGRVLQEQYGAAEVMTYRKISQSMPTPPPVLDEMAAECDAIIHAVAD